MKKSLSLAVGLSLLFAGIAMAAKVHQKADGKSAFAGGGGSALDAKKIETKQVEGVEVARVTGTTDQWGFVNYWLGIPAPAGHAVVRVRIFKTDEPTAKYAIYVGDKGPFTLAVPAETKNGEFVEQDVPVDLGAEWSRITLKKISKDTLPGPWIDSLTVLVD